MFDLSVFKFHVGSRWFPSSSTPFVKSYGPYSDEALSYSKATFNLHERFITHSILFKHFRVTSDVFDNVYLMTDA